MKIKIIEEAGHTSAVTGMRLSFQQECPLDDIIEATGVDTKTTRTLANLDGGHNKFLESIMVWMDIKAPFYWWKQFDTYRIGVTKQSKSTMHTLMKRQLTREDFDESVNVLSINLVNHYITVRDFDGAISNLPDGYLQTRRVCLSYKVLRHIIKQRRNHKLPGWRAFCDIVKDNVKYPRLLGV